MIALGELRVQVTGIHQPIVGTAPFDRVQQMLRGRPHKKVKDLSGLRMSPHLTDRVGRGGAF